MAQSEYTEGVPTVAPSLEGRASYQTGRGADIDAFGGGIAQAGERFGEGLKTGMQFFNKVAADDASNRFQDFASKLLHGDPSKMVAGPDGTQVPETGYLGTKGRAALDARPGVDKALNDKIKELRSELQTPEQQAEFDNFSRRYRTGVIERVGNHADRESSSWYTSVNVASAKLAMDHISRNFDSPKDVAAGAADLTHAYVKNAQIKGGGQLEIQQAINDARRDALAAQLDAMAVNDPARAARVLEKNRDIAGVKYDEMATKFRSRADQQIAIGVGVDAIKRTYQGPQKTVYTDVELSTAGEPYGISGSYLSRVHALEGDGVSSTGAKGPFQFIDSTARQYGVKDPFDKMQAAAGAARLAADNKAQLGRELGRTPTWAEVYLAHQQGAGGAAALLENPTMTAQQALMTLRKYANDPAGAARAIRVNGGDPNAPAAQFTSMWAARFAGAPGMATAQRKASALQTVLENPDISEQQRSQAIAYVNQQMTAQRFALEEDEKALKAAREQIQSDFTSQIIRGGNPNILEQIAASPLTGPEKQNLYNFATNRGGIADPLQYGPGYTQAFKAILSDPSDPSHISDIRTLIERGGPGGDLTPRGVEHLAKTMQALQKDPNQSGIQKSKASVLTYYAGQFSPEPEFKGAPINQKGLDKYNREFIPAFETAYGEWVKGGKDPMVFLQDQKQLDAIMNRVYPPAQRNADKITMGVDVTAPPQPNPPAPAGADQKAWDRFMNAPPNTRDGKPWTKENWAKAIEKLRADPSETMQKAFDKHFAPSGYTAKDILSRLPPAQKKAEGPNAVQRAATAVAAPFVNKGEVVDFPGQLGIRG